MISRRFSPFLCVALLAGCASIPDAPEPVLFDAQPVGGPFTSLEALARAPERRLTYPAPSPPPLPYAAPEIDWWPERPRQAGAVVVRVSQPVGPRLENVEVRFAGHPVSLAEHETGWVGVGGLPLDSAGFFGLEVTFDRDERPERRTVVVPTTPRTYPSSRIRISAGGPADPEVDARIARERELIQRALSVVTPDWIPDEAIGWPRDPVIRTSPFGGRRLFNGSVRSRHLGLDLRAFHGHPIFAPAAGRVALAGRFFYQGNAVYLDHGLGVYTAYFHMSRLRVEEGDIVEPGQVLGLSGSTGRSTAAHLHWSAYVGGRTVDPESLVGLWLDTTPGEEAATEASSDRDGSNGFRE